MKDRLKLKLYHLIGKLTRNYTLENRLIFKIKLREHSYIPSPRWGNVINSGGKLVMQK